MPHLSVRSIHFPYTDHPTLRIYILLLNLSLAHGNTLQKRVVWTDLFMPHVDSVQSVSGLKHNNTIPKGAF